MAFFDQPPEPESASKHERYDDGTAPWLPGVVLCDVVLAQNERVAVVLRSVEVFREWFQLNVWSYVHHSVEFESGTDDPFGVHWRHGPRTTELPAGLLRVGVEWPDGGKATNVDRLPPPMRQQEGRPHMLEARGGGGSTAGHHSDYLGWPVPDAGDLKVVVEWPAHGITETSTAVDGDELRAARGDARPVWEVDRDRPDQWGARYRWS